MSENAAIYLDMQNKSHDKPRGAPTIRPPCLSDLRISLSLGWRDFTAAPVHAMFFVAFYVFAGLIMAAITLVALIPLFLGLFIAMPVLGHATWHLYKRVTNIET